MTFRTVFEAWQWFTSPWAMPFIGAIAAVLAALTVDPLSWIRAPVRAIGRAAIVVVAWMLAVWILQKTSGFLPGSGGAGTSPGSSDPVVEVMTISGLPPGASPESIAIRFLPASDDPKKAKAFSCEIIVPGRSEKDDPKAVTIRETSMVSFKDKLSKALREHVSEEGKPLWTSATIAQQPYPGEPAILIVVGCIKATFPAISIERVAQEAGDSR